jgi:acetyltransferase-like isoleucine patch superfamily enzyme
LARIATLRAYLWARIWGIEIGPDCWFAGAPNWQRFPGSRIVIGSHCRFRSARWSNRVGVNRPCMISTLLRGAEVVIGNRVGMTGTIIAAQQSVRIGNDAMLGANVTIMDTDFHNPSASDRQSLGASAPVALEENVWLGLNVVVTKGVTIGRDSVIAACSLVTKSIPAGVVAGGIPARVIRAL